MEIPSIYFSHKRNVISRDGILIAKSDFIEFKEEDVFEKDVRCRTVGDITTTGLWESKAATIEEIIAEISVSNVGERGKRADDKLSLNSMEDRKRKGYF